VFYDHNGTCEIESCTKACGLKNAMFQRLASEFGVPFVDLDGTIAKDRDHFVDAVHFNPAGMEFVATRVANFVVDEMVLARRLRSVAT